MKKITMKFKIASLLILSTFLSTVFAQSEVLFKSGFEPYRIYLNDTGITLAAESPSGFSFTCNSATISSPQDCHTGRDVPPWDNSDGLAGFSFTKLDATGQPLADQSADYETQPWACVKDNVTGLVWEIKTATEGLHYQYKRYKWGGLTAVGRDHPSALGEYYDDWNELVEGSNNEGLCGFADWRVPSMSELTSILALGTSDPVIDTSYFPHTDLSGYWTSDPFVIDELQAVGVVFSKGHHFFNSRDASNLLRLVHSPE